MHSWLVLLDTNNFIMNDGDLYACTPNAWTSMSKFCSLLLEECWASSPNPNVYSGLLNGFVSMEDYRYVWFDSHQYARSCNMEFMQSFEVSSVTDKNTLYWFYLPLTYQHITHTYVELKGLHLGKVPFVTRNEVVTQISDESMPLTSSQLRLVAADPTDLLFYCIQSQHMSSENVVMASDSDSIDKSIVKGFPHHHFRCLSSLEFYSKSANQVPVQAVKNDDDLNMAVTPALTDEYEIDETSMLKIMKDEPDEDCTLAVLQKTQQNLQDEVQQFQSHQSPRYDNLPSFEAGRRKEVKCSETKGLSFSRLLSISKSYGKFVASQENAGRKIWRSVSSRVVPSIVLQCPGCGRFFPQSSPTSLYDMLSHIRRRHKKNGKQMLSSIADVLEILIPFMQKKISKWNNITMK